jgi:hypothetical protein
MMTDAIRRNQFIQDSEVSLIEAFIKNAVDDELAMNSGHECP